MCRSIPLSKRLKFRTYGKCGGNHYIGEITVKLDEHETMDEIQEKILEGLEKCPKLEEQINELNIRVRDEYGIRLNAENENQKLKAELEQARRLLTKESMESSKLRQELEKEKEEHRIWYSEADKLSDVLFMIRFEMEGFERSGATRDDFSLFHKSIRELVRNEKLQYSTYQKLRDENGELTKQLECYREHDSTLEKLISTHTLISLADLQKYQQLVHGLEHVVNAMVYAEARKEFHTLGYWRMQIFALFNEVIKS